MQKFKVCLKENRLVFQNPPEAPKTVVAEDPMAKVAKEGFKNPDGSYYDPVTGSYFNGSGLGQSMDPKDALPYKQANAGPFVDVKVDVAEAAKQAEPAKAADVAKQAADAKAAEAEAAKAAAKVETKQETGTQRVELKTQMDLDALKNKMAGEFEALVAAVSLGGKSIEGSPSAVNFSTITLDEKVLSDKVLKLLDLEKLKNFANKLKQATGVEIKAEDADDLLALIYANSIVAKTKKAFTDRYSRYNEFLTNLPKPVTLSPEKFPFDVKFGKGVDFDVVLKVENTEFDNVYKEYIAANPKAKEAPKPPTAQEENLKARAKVLQDSFAGKALAWLGLVKLEEAPEGKTEDEDAKVIRLKRNQDAYAAAINGENTFAKWVVWLLGGGAMLDGGGEDIAASLKDMDPKHAAIVAGLQKQAKALPFSLDKAAQKVPRLESVAGGDVDSVGEIKFGEIVKDNKNMPERGVKLSEGYKVEVAQKLTIDLSGGEMTVPEGQPISVWNNGKSEVKTIAKDDKPFKDTTLVLIGQLPVGTTFKGKPRLKLDKMTA